MSRRTAPRYSRRHVLLPALATLLLALVWPLAARRPAHDAAFERINSIVAVLSRISGLTQEHRVPYGRMDKRQLRKFLVKRIRKSLKPAEIRANELSLKMFGLVPAGFDLKTSTIDLLTEQAAAFYDYDEKKLFLTGMVPLDAETETLAHELSHALADQHFQLGKYMNDVDGRDDASLARTAVVEGQATWLMLAYALAQSGRDPEPPPGMLHDVFSSGAASTADYPVLNAAPLYIRQSLLFPYAEGTRFFDDVYRKQGKQAFSNVFTDPPVDSAQILHPQRYFEHVRATHPALPALFLFGDRKLVSDGDVGEFDHLILLWQYLDEPSARDLAPHLRGGQFRIVAGKATAPVLLYSSSWDSPESARKFFAAYQRVLRGKWKNCHALLDSPGLFAGQGDNGYFVTRAIGSRVTSVEGMTNVNDWRELKNSSPEKRSEK